MFVVQSLCCDWLFVTPWTAALSFTISQSLLKLISVELVLPSNHLILCYPLLLLPSIFSALGSFLVSLLLDDHYFWWDYCIKKLKFIYMSLWKHFWKIWYLYSHSDYTTWIYLDYIINFLTEPSNSTVYIFNYLVKENIFWRMLMQFGEGNGTSLWYSCLENPMGEAAW